MKKNIIFFILFIIIIINVNSNEYYKSEEAVFLADNYLLFQRNTGGWSKAEESVYDMKKSLTEEEIRIIKSAKTNTNDSTIDNNATTTQMIFLAKVYNATKNKKYMQGFIKGLNYLLLSQYDNGGWAQYFPLKGKYHDNITFNDNAMINVMVLLKNIIEDNLTYDFVSQELKEKCKTAYIKGIDCILKTQIVFNGKLTAWCQQYDPVTLKPAWARNFEPPAISSLESYHIVKFLISLDNPEVKIINAIQSAVLWFDAVKIYGIKVVKITDKLKSKGYDLITEYDPESGPIWARFYEIETNKAIFANRDKKIFYDFNENEYERRLGYIWYNNKGSELITKSYLIWQEKWAPDKNVLNK